MFFWLLKAWWRGTKVHVEIADFRLVGIVKWVTPFSACLRISWTASVGDMVERRERDAVFALSHVKDMSDSYTEVARQVLEDAVRWDGSLKDSKAPDSPRHWS